MCQRLFFMTVEINGFCRSARNGVAIVVVGRFKGIIVNSLLCSGIHFRITGRTGDQSGLDTAISSDDDR